MIFTNSYGFTFDQYVYDATNTKTESLREFDFRDATTAHTHTVTRNPTFLGESHVLFDACFKNYSLVFNMEDMHFSGKIMLPTRDNLFSTNSSIPHPFHCLIAVTNKNFINFITPTS